MKAPLVLLLAVWLTVAPHHAAYVADIIARDISEGGVMLGRLGAWIDEHLTRGSIRGAAVLAWIDGVTTAAEGFLLLSGRPWGEWLVIAALAGLIPFEAVSLGRQPSLVKLTVLTVNAAVVAYLVFRRVLPRRKI